MDVRIEETGESSRHLHIVVSAATLDKNVEIRLKKRAKTSRLDGFRPGKAPMKIIKSLYYKEALVEAVDEEINASYRRAVADHQLDVIDYQLVDKELSEAHELRFTVALELRPQFDLLSLDKEEFEDYLVSVNKDDLDKMVNLLRRNQAEWKAVERPARRGDRVYTALADEKEARSFLGSRDNSFRWLLDSEKTDTDIIRLLEGCRVGDTFSMPLTGLSAEGQSPQKKDYEVRIERVEEAVLPALDSDFYKRIGADDGDEQIARVILRHSMEREASLINGRYQRATLMRRLLEKNVFEAPESLVNRECDRLRAKLKEQLPKEEFNLLPEDNSGLWDQARQNVRWALLSHRLAEEFHITVSQEQLEKEVHRHAASYENPQEVKKQILHSRRLLATFHNILMENQMMDKVLEGMKKTPIPCTFSEFMEKPAIAGKKF